MRSNRTTTALSLFVIATITLMSGFLIAKAQPPPPPPPPPGEEADCDCWIGTSHELTTREICEQFGGECRGDDCLIATAAFGSELTPQVQFLREFRDQRILATSSGSSFMNVFNGFYYSFSPAVAEYERERPWLQDAFKVAIYPLLTILQIAEKSYSYIPGEYGSISAGLVASSLIGVVYFSPIALSIGKIRTSAISPKIAVLIVVALAVGVVVALFSNFSIALMVTTSGLVISAILFSALYSANLIARIAARISKMARRE